MERYPSTKRMIEMLGITPDQAKRIREIMEGPKLVASANATRLERIDAVLDTCGVEYIPKGRNKKSPGIHYCNTGDSYGYTILKVNGDFKVGSWGDIVERGNYD